MTAPSGKPDELEAGAPAPASSLMDTVPDDSTLRARSSSTPSPAPSAASRTFGKYRLLAELGRGGMADVHLAVSVGPAGFSKLQVIKRLRPGMTDEAEMRHMMLDEARLAARLNHKNIVQTNEVGIVDDQYFLAMEYLDGQPYHRILKRATQLGRTVPLPFAVKILCEVLSGLHYAHECRDYDGVSLGVVHRDVSPQNVFVTYDGQVKVVDFGIAKSTGRLVETQTGIIRGKLTYMAPEQAFAAEVDRRADLFSVGVLLWEALAGERLWGNMSDPEIVAKLMNEIPPVTSVRPDAPADLADLCARALSRDREKRPATAAEMRGELEAYLATHDIQVNAEALGALVVDLFSEERDELSRLVDRELAMLRMGEDLERSDIAKIKRITEPTDLRAKLPGAPALPGAMRIPGHVGAPGRAGAPSAPNPATPAAPSVRDLRASPDASGLRRSSEIPVLRRSPDVGGYQRAPIERAPDSMSAPTLPRAPAFEVDPSRDVSPPGAVIHASGPPSSVTVPAVMWNQRPKWRHPAVYVAALLFVAAGAVLLLIGTLSPTAPLASGDSTSPTGTTPSVAQSAPPSTASSTGAATGAPTFTAPPDANYVKLRITTNPQQTRILYDGSPLPPGASPYEAKFPKDGAVHRITVEATGFYPQSRMVVFDKDQSMDFILHSKKGAPPPKDSPYH